MIRIVTKLLHQHRFFSISSITWRETANNQSQPRNHENSRDSNKNRQNRQGNARNWQGNRQQPQNRPQNQQNRIQKDPSPLKPKVFNVPKPQQNQETTGSSSWLKNLKSVKMDDLVPEEEVEPAEYEERSFKKRYDDKQERHDQPKEDKYARSTKNLRDLEQKFASSHEPLDKSARRELKQARNMVKYAKKSIPKVAPMPKKVRPSVIHLPDSVSILQLAQLMKLPVNAVIRTVVNQGVLKESQAGPEHMLSAEMASLIVMEHNMIPIMPVISAQDLFPRPVPEDWSIYPERPPVVAIMGHVDHGKTTLLDTLRKASVAAGEAGGITQHIGAFSVELPSGKRVTFLDTPGHAAFSAIRSRGANATDIVVLIVAADDGVMPQTIESIKMAESAGVSVIVAVNKCDKPQADVETPMMALMQHGIQVEQLGGDVPCVHVSGLTGHNLDQLVETISTLAEVSLDVRGDPEGPVEGVILEASLDKERGTTATVLVKRGTLRPGDILIAGTAWCKVRLICDENGNVMSEAPPSTPCQILGWKELPMAGEIVLQPRDEAQAKAVVETRLSKMQFEKSLASADLQNEQRLKHRNLRQDGVKTDDMVKAANLDTSNDAKLPLIVKADVQGSLDAIVDFIRTLPTDLVNVYLVDDGVGSVTIDDVNKASVANSVIYAFNLPRPGSRVVEAAKANNVIIKSHNIIYQIMDDLKQTMDERVPIEIRYDVLGEAVVQQVFDININNKSIETVAGCKVGVGKLARNSSIRILRDVDGKEEQVYLGSFKTMKHFKKDVDEVSKGQECGLAVQDFKDYKEGDRIQAINRIEFQRKNKF